MHPHPSCSSQIGLWWDHEVTVVPVHFTFPLTYSSTIPTAYFWILQIIHLLLFSFSNHLSATLYPWNISSYLFQNCVISSWCYKQIGAELVTWPCTCVAVAPAYSWVMFFKTISIWIMIRSFYLWKISFASANINSTLFFFFPLGLFLLAM